jgi:hypothetical protein
MKQIKILFSVLIGIAMVLITIMGALAASDVDAGTANRGFFAEVNNEDQQPSKDIPLAWNQQTESEVKLPSGLGNAMVQVKNQETVQRLEQVLAKIETKRMAQLNNMRNLQIEEKQDGTIEARGSKDAKFLGLLPARVQAKYIIMEDGSVVRQKGMLDFLYTEESE